MSNAGTSDLVTKLRVNISSSGYDSPYVARAAEAQSHARAFLRCLTLAQRALRLGIGHTLLRASCYAP
jgi:hypothetical protein